MIRLTHQQWDNLHRLVQDIHSASSYETLRDFAVKELPLALEASYACWSVAGPFHFPGDGSPKVSFSACGRRAELHVALATHSCEMLSIQRAAAFRKNQRFMLHALHTHFQVAVDKLCGSDSPSSLVFVNPLTRREKETLPLLQQGMTNPEIAKALGVSPRTIEKHVASILEKTGLDNRRMLINKTSR